MGLKAIETAHNINLRSIRKYRQRQESVEDEEGLPMFFCTWQQLFESPLLKQAIDKIKKFPETVNVNHLVVVHYMGKN